MASSLGDLPMAAIAERTAPSSARIAVRPTGAGAGGEMAAIDLRTIEDGAFAAIRRAFVEHSVLLFRGQRLSDEDLIAFSRRFGALDQAPVQENGRRFVEGRPEIYVVSNVIENGIAIGSLGAGEAVWHTHMAYLADPPMASMLYALEIPPQGGNTGFCKMYGGQPGPPDALETPIAGLQVKEDG